MNTNQAKIKILIVDNEKKACDNVKNILLEFVDPEIDIVGVAYNTREAEEKINEFNPDGVFLDIEMPEENAFHFLDRISPVNFEVIFVTAYDDYAIRAFRLNAIDYILKPISISELENAVKKLKEKVRFKQYITHKIVSYSELAEQVSNKTKQNKIRVKHANGNEVIDFNDIYFIEAQSSYSKILFNKNGSVKELTMSHPLSDYEEILPEETFYRIHRSYLINCAQIKQISDYANCRLTLNNDLVVPVSRRKFEPLLEFLKSNDYL